MVIVEKDYPIGYESINDTNIKGGITKTMKYLYEVVKNHPESPIKFILHSKEIDKSFKKTYVLEVENINHTFQVEQLINDVKDFYITNISYCFKKKSIYFSYINGIAKVIDDSEYKNYNSIIGSNSLNSIVNNISLYLSTNLPSQQVPFDLKDRIRSVLKILFVNYELSDKIYVEICEIKYRDDDVDQIEYSYVSFQSINIEIPLMKLKIEKYFNNLDIVPKNSGFQIKLIFSKLKRKNDDIYIKNKK